LRDVSAVERPLEEVATASRLYLGDVSGSLSAASPNLACSKRSRPRSSFAPPKRAVNLVR